MQVKFKVYKDIQINDLEIKLNEITKEGNNVVQVIPVTKQAYASSFETTITIVSVDGQPWLQQTDAPKDTNIEEKVS